MYLKVRNDRQSCGLESILMHADRQQDFNLTGKVTVKVVWALLFIIILGLDAWHIHVRKELPGPV